MASKHNSGAARRAARVGRRKAQRNARRQVQRAGNQRERRPDMVTSYRAENALAYELTDELVEALRTQRKLFVEKFGREPSGSDPVFFDPGADEPKMITEEQSSASFRAVLAEAGLDDAHADAYDELGYIVTESNRHLFSKAEVDAYISTLSRFP